GTVAPRPASTAPARDDFRRRARTLAGSGHRPSAHFLAPGGGRNRHAGCGANEWRGTAGWRERNSQRTPGPQTRANVTVIDGPYFDSMTAPRARHQISTIVASRADDCQCFESSGEQ